MDQTKSHSLIKFKYLYLIFLFYLKKILLISSSKALQKLIFEKNSKLLQDYLSFRQYSVLSTQFRAALYSQFISHDKFDDMLLFFLYSKKAELSHVLQNILSCHRAIHCRFECTKERRKGML